MSLKKKFVDEVKSCVGCLYRWGGQGPSRFDCSGLVLYCLARVGIDIPDMAVRHLRDYWHNNKKLFVCAEPGDLIFYGDTPEHLHHVMIVSDVWGPGEPLPMMSLIGARGGDSFTTNDKRAYQQKACVDVVLGSYWQSKAQLIIDPFR